MLQTACIPVCSQNPATSLPDPPPPYTTGGTTQVIPPVGGPPVAQLAALTDGGNAVTINFNKPLKTTPLPAPSSFIIVRNFISKIPSSVVISGSTVKLMLDATYSPGPAAVVSYTPGTNPLKGTDDALVAAFSDLTIAQ